MVMSPDKAKDTLGDLLGGMRTEADEYEKLKKWRIGEVPAPYKPRDADDDYEALMEKSEANFIGLVVKVLTQAIELRGYAPSVADPEKRLWTAFSQNRMQTRQKRLYRATMTSGTAYSSLRLVKGRVVSKVHSAANAFAVYEDAEADEFAQLAVVRGKRHKDGDRELTLMDNTSLYMFVQSDGGLEHIGAERHGLEVPPIVRFTGEMDTEGDVTGEVQPLIEPQASIMQTKADRLVAQSYASWVVRVLTGVEKPTDEFEAIAQNFELSQKRFILADNENAKAQTFGTTNLAQYIEAGRSDKQELAALAQVPQKSIIGAQANQSDGAEAQAAEESSMQRKLHDYETSLGESWASWFRISGGLLEIPGAFDDYGGALDWRDSEIRSMSQMADALGKFASMLGVPVEGLWDLIPNVSPERIASWKQLREADPYGLMLSHANQSVLDDEAV